MAQLRVTPEQLRERATEYRNQSQAMEEITQKLDNLISKLESEWEGVSAERYHEQYADLRPSFVSMTELIADLASQLDKKASDYEAADR
jgi:WXG100 family type VII secretion target